MTRTARRILLGGTALLTAGLLVIYLTRRPEFARDEPMPGTALGLAQWLRERPADPRAAAALAAMALDTNVREPAALWRAAYDHARRLAPNQTTANTAFVRGGLLHWYELGPADREAVLQAAAPLLREQRAFAAMHRPLWDLTHDLDYLRRNAPDSEKALTWLADLAAMEGRFAEYRSLRAAIGQKRLEALEANRDRLSPPELVAMIPARLSESDEPLVRGVLAQLQRHPLDAGNAAAARSRAAELVRFAIRHGLDPLDGLDAILDTPSISAATRARLAIALGRPDTASNIELSAALGRTTEWIPYYLERGDYEAARGDQAMAALYRRRATAAGLDESLSPRAPLQWTDTCGANEVCDTAVARVLAARAGEEIEIHLQNAQSDDVPPYVEIYVDDARVAEGPVAASETFRIRTANAGMNRIEIRLANPWTRNRVHRRVRLS